MKTLNEFINDLVDIAALHPECSEAIKHLAVRDLRVLLFSGNLQEIRNFPVHSEPVGSAGCMSDIAAIAIKS
jgi:hypothetical protein